MSGVWHAPGRVNLIGEHTDYNQGLVLPCALPQGVTVRGERRDDGVLSLRSGEEGVDVLLDDVRPGSIDGWAAYPAGVAACLRDAGHAVGGANLRITSDLPQGAGLSSSAALECTTAIALRDLYGLPVDRPALARIAQRAEHRYAGVPCGILDQSASLLCRADHALLLDCRSETAVHVPLRLGEHRILVINTMAGHRLGDGEYATRRDACRHAAELLGLDSLRDVHDLPAALAALPTSRLRARVEHVVTENRRVLETVELLRSGAVAAVGPLLTASHRSLRDHYEVSWPEADVAVEEALRAGAAGARMVGGGFGGSAIALVHRDRVAAVARAVTAAYAARDWTAPAFLQATAAPGARALSSLPDERTHDSAASVFRR